MGVNLKQAGLTRWDDNYPRRGLVWDGSLIAVPNNHKALRGR